MRAGRGPGGSRTKPVGASAAVLLPEADNRLADGVVVEAQLRARIFGAPVLRVDGTVLVSPGQLVENSPDVVPGSARRTNGVNARSGQVNGHPGEALARAEALLAEARARLAGSD